MAVTGQGGQGRAGLVVQRRPRLGGELCTGIRRIHTHDRHGTRRAECLKLWSAEAAHGLSATMDRHTRVAGWCHSLGGRLKRGMLLLRLGVKRVRKPDRRGRRRSVTCKSSTRRRWPDCRAGSLPCSLLEAARGAAGRHPEPSETVRAPLQDPDRLLRLLPRCVMADRTGQVSLPSPTHLRPARGLHGDARTAGGGFRAEAAVQGGGCCCCRCCSMRARLRFSDRE